MPEPLQLGKLSGRTIAATSDTGHLQSRLLFVTDAQIHTKFFVDTGSEFSVISPYTPANTEGILLTPAPSCTGQVKTY